LALVVNAFGNGLSVASYMGTSPWTASKVNLSHWLGTSGGLAIFVVSCLATIANQLLLTCHDNVVIAQLLTFTPPVTIILVCWINTHQLHAVNCGTLFTLLFNGALIGLADRFVWPQLHHNFRAKPVH